MNYGTFLLSYEDISVYAFYRHDVPIIASHLQQNASLLYLIAWDFSVACLRNSSFILDSIMTMSWSLSRYITCIFWISAGKFVKNRSSIWCRQVGLETVWDKLWSCVCNVQEELLTIQISWSRWDCTSLPFYVRWIVLYRLTLIDQKLPHFPWTHLTL